MQRTLAQRYDRIGLRVPQILLPRRGVELQSWAVIACDQFTSSPEYWAEVESFVGERPSTLRLMLPERYLGEPSVDARVRAIHTAMKHYLEEGIFGEPREGFVLVNRRSPDGRARWGLVAEIDLECYDYGRNSTSLIRATEGTIAERIPPRTTVRRGAPLELPHVLVLYDDPDNRVLARAIARVPELETLYDFDLMMASGHITGYQLSDEPASIALLEGFEQLADASRFARRHGRNDVLLFAVGDGNHSLAAAKTIWEETKRSGSVPSDHPARYALVELVNIHDPGLRFEPIHRVLFHGAASLLREIEGLPGAEVRDVEGFADVKKAVALRSGTQRVGIVTEERIALLELREPTASLAAGTLQPLLDSFLARTPAASVDYIHGDDEAAKLGRQPGNAAFFLPAIRKSDFFTTIVRDGSFPRKTFSMGEAEEKRFYLEARSIEPA